MYFQPRFVQGEEADIQAAVPVEDHGQDVRPDGVPTLRRYLQALWRRKWIVVVALVVIPLVTLVSSLREPDAYEASADVLVNRQEVATTALIGQTPALDDAGRTMQTQASLARVPLVIERTFAAADVTGVSVQGYLSSSSVYPLADILRFTVTDADPTRAALLASVQARQYVRYRRELDTAGLAQTLEGLTKRIRQLERAGEVETPLYERLADNEQQLESLESLRMSNVSVIRTAGPGDAQHVAPRPRRDTAIAAAAALVIGLVLAFLWESLSTRPRSEDEFEALLGMPLLARLRLGARKVRVRPVGDPGLDADAIHALRSSLDLANAAVGARTIMITSPRSDEGKSAAAVQLAVAYARAGRHVVLVDLDFRKSSVSELLGVQDAPGVTTVVRGECELAQALVAISPDDGLGRSSTSRSNGRGSTQTLLEVVGSGPLTVHPAELLGSERLAAMLEELTGRADVVLLDAPPMLEAPDAASVAPQLDGLLLVVDSRRARGPDLAEARRAFDMWPVEKLGFVLIDRGARQPYVGRLGRTVSSARQQTSDPERVG